MRKIQSVLIAIVLLTAGAALAQVKGVIVTKEGGNKMAGVIKWSVRDKAYKVTRATNGTNIDLIIELDKIQQLYIPKPKEIDDAQALITKGNAAQAIPLLKKVIDGYFMLNWDETATSMLADAYLADGQSKKVMEICEKIIAADPTKAYLGEMAPSYWKALLMEDRLSKLDDLLAKAIKEGDRTASAFALIARGDLIRKESDTDENALKALHSGFLRVVTLYKGIKAAQPEALYKAAQCFDKLGQSSRADQMRTILKDKYGSSTWARK